RSLVTRAAAPVATGGGDDVGRPWGTGLQRTVRATAHTGAAGLAVLGNGHALPVGCGIGDLPRHCALAETGVGSDGGGRLVVEDVRREEGLRGRINHQAGRVAALVGRGQIAGHGANVALVDDRVAQCGLDDALLEVGRVDVGADVAADLDGRAGLLSGVRIDIWHSGRTDGDTVEADRHDVAGLNVGRHVRRAGGVAPADAAGMVDLEGHVS